MTNDSHAMLFPNSEIETLTTSATPRVRPLPTPRLIKPERLQLRAATAELPNAHLRNQGVYQMRVRGLAKVKAALWWHVLALNLMRAAVLRAARAKAAQIPCAPRG